MKKGSNTLKKGSNESANLSVVCKDKLKGEHEHIHAANCGHRSYVHNGHIDYFHDGHFHHMHDGHVHECTGPAPAKVIPITAAKTTTTKTK